ncbi:MAG: glycoside hydrolase TIM-barrel-like domain-containing protein, partial [Pseudomonadota bacterium]|nr:glycoside hydrolase TIM-barrel-like domain-containing protein [Pseudomonadota bacterium]
MATILLQAAGAAIGGLLGPVGAAIGAAAGAFAGYSIDQALINGTRRIEGPRLSGARPFTAEEGAAIPRVYGTARVGGIMIWATRFEERRSTRREGGKNGPKITEYSYFANIAFALCEGEIAGVRRIWADGREIDRERIELRIHRGTEAQAADPLVSARQGADNTPAYRGTAYVVIERFMLGDYGNRIPQFQFEVLRPVGELPKRIRAISLIPGATEYGLSPSLVTRRHRQGETEAVNRHTLLEGSDLTASLDELQMLCPNLEHVALVVAWFGDDLRAGHCRIRPAVTMANGSGFSRDWRVSGVSRGSAMVVSTHDGGAAYGGTPSDRSVMDAIAEIKARGLKVTLYPFIMMDVPGDNDLPDPYGNPAQPAYPWRGRITADPAPLMPGTADRTAAARDQVEEFLGNALPGQFSASANTINFSGSSGDWGFRRFVLHHARLAQAAGGVDAFLIGSELRGLTTLRDEDDGFPFVEALCTLAGETRAMLGPATKITYGADWSEYFGHHPLDGTGNVHFHLDPLWAHPDIDAVGIDNYMPLSDWRDADHAAGNPDGFAGPYDPAGLRAAIAGGEGFDWYYPTFEARRLRERAPITDGAFGKPWVFRAKDLKGWWSELHYDRIDGTEVDEPTAWVPESKPFFFTEVGCPATDKGPNQPNVFSDPKSTEAA